MTRMLAPTLLFMSVLSGFGCSSDGVAPSDDDGGSLVGGAGPRDAGRAAPKPMGAGNDSEAGRATGAAKADAGPVGATAQLDASSAGAGTRPGPDGGADASQAPDTEPDSSVSAGAKPSAGCGKAGRPNGGRVGVPGDHNYTFPASYDGKRPFPLLLGFHAAGNPIEQIEDLTKGSDFEKNYVRAFPKSKGSAWDYATDMRTVSAMYDALLANYCIDTARIFATGHSSGAQLIVQMLTPAHKTDADHFNLKAVAPVAASRYGALSRAVAVLYIQGQHDSVRNSDGSDVVKEFATGNGCSMASHPYAAAPSCTSSGKAVHDGCIQYDGCQVPTVWCSHDDPQYSNTSHGWPCFATKSMYDFFAALP